MVGCHHQSNGYEFEQTPGVGERQVSMVCCSPWGCKELDMIHRLKINIFVLGCAKSSFLHKDFL